MNDHRTSLPEVITEKRENVHCKRNQHLLNVGLAWSVSQSSDELTGPGEWHGSRQTMQTDAHAGEGWSENGKCRPRCWGLRVGAGLVVDVWDNVWGARAWEACSNDRPTLTGTEKNPCADTKPRLAENTHDQMLGNCGWFCCAYMFKVVG